MSPPLQLPVVEMEATGQAPDAADSEDIQRVYLYLKGRKSEQVGWAARSEPRKMHGISSPAFAAIPADVVAMSDAMLHSCAAFCVLPGPTPSFMFFFSSLMLQDGVRPGV